MSKKRCSVLYSPLIYRSGHLGRQLKTCVSTPSFLQTIGAADKLFNGLSLGGQIEGPIGDSSWGHILDVLETNTALNGLWNLTENKTEKCKRKRQTPKATLAICLMSSFSLPTYSNNPNNQYQCQVSRYGDPSVYLKWEY